jgi:peptidoglycan/LPS O-acetylase OafA/YrhL
MAAATRPPEIPALTGLRFLAALCVAVPHAWIVFMRGEGGLIWPALTNLSSLGMTMFFVLSGFVIHYNYGHDLAVGQGRPLARFLVARFARLYPLYLLVVGLELALGPFLRKHLYGWPVERHGLEALLPQFTLTQSWFYTLWDSHPPVYQYGPIAEVSWSISTEWFFYLAFPLVVPLLTRLRTPRAVLSAIALLVAAGATLLLAAHAGHARIDAFAIRNFGPEAASLHIQNGFFRWLTYFSPYARLPEFLLGCLLAQLHLTAPCRWTPRARLALGIAVPMAFAWIGALLTVTHGAMTDLPRMMLSSLGLAPPVGVLLLAGARSTGLAGWLLGSRAMLGGGEASYGIYMLHIPVIRTVGAPPVPPEGSAWPNLIALAVALGAVLVLALVAHRGFEVPARAWLRRRLAPEAARGRVVARIGGTALAASGAMAAVLLTAPAFGLGSAPSLQPGAITLVQAIYGGNCPRAADVRPRIAAACESHAACEVTLRVEDLGDPAPGCSKGFSAAYVCGPDARLRHLVLPPEAGLGSVARLSCLGYSTR